jgi:hypothetical protein
MSSVKTGKKKKKNIHRMKLGLDLDKIRPPLIGEEAPQGAQPLVVVINSMLVWSF